MSNNKSFLKWVGGKRQLLPEISKRYPEAVTKYCEPFVGGGTVLFDVTARFKPEKILINDINPNLINLYEQIKTNPEKIVDELRRIEDVYIEKSDLDRRKMYNVLRDKYNKTLPLSSDSMKFQNAVLFLFINKTCFNGLYRVNKAGQYNVPMGEYKNPNICNKEAILNASNLLQHTQIQCGSYKDCLEFIDSDTFVYMDPPYRPLTKTSAFTSYSNSAFGDDEQRELKAFADSCNDKGAKFILSNSDPTNADPSDTFFDDLYKDYIIERISAKRCINSKAEARGSINELLIRNF